MVRQPAVKRCEIDVHSAHHDARLRFKVAIGNFFLHNFCISVPSVILIVILILGKGCTTHNFEVILRRKKMLKALVCVSCIFLLLLYFGEKSIVNCNLEAAGGGFSLGFHGSDLLGSHIAKRQERQERQERQGDKRVSIVETNRSSRHTSSPRQIRAARAKCLADVGAY